MNQMQSDVVRVHRDLLRSRKLPNVPLFHVIIVERMDTKSVIALRTTTKPVVTTITVWTVGTKRRRRPTVTMLRAMNMNFMKLFTTKGNCTGLCLCLYGPFHQIGGAIYAVAIYPGFG